ncbi:hypothetical protein PUNSTDRAFT_102178 [Punctularia strigosozonata HHB-11173 SS5]|uniref:uncharacterized protein n=1 Tax=Punctularia strigosozonata (strain HHB-11173) TaxID=741275 RepID=UPI0004416D92|nr:uncharacterized protein PUNSTDRAFT_102178 [Punctularia strigosozonata HHB-11173 SS5]EIN08717.1 hypothetical protein PUNSTDRAFT_102178 [Punctularia strigosozonata HHB-11173 SS5]
MPNQSTSSPPDPPYLIRTGELQPDALHLRPHVLNPAVQRLQLSLGDSVGLTKTGIHLIRLRVRPQQTSTVLHWHGVDDEWFYVLEAGDDAVVCVQEGAGHEVKEHKVRPGDFAGFPAGKPWGHAFKSGNAELVYLCGGTSTSVDECHYPLLGKRVLIDRGVGKASWVVSEDKVHGQKVQKYATRE